MTLKVFKTMKTGMRVEADPGTLLVVKGHLYVNTQDELLEILQLQQSGKKRMAARDFVNGLRI